MSDIRAVLNDDRTIKAVLNNDTTVKAVLLSGVSVNQKIDGGEYIHFDVSQNGNNQIFTSQTLSQYISNTSINLFKNGVYLPPTNFEKIANTSIRLNVELVAGDKIDILATGSAALVPIANTTPGGVTTQIQFNNNGILDGTPGLTYDGNTQSLTANNFSASNVMIDIGNANVLSVNTLNAVDVNVTGNANLSGADSLTVNDFVANTANIQSLTSALSSITIASVGQLGVSGNSNLANLHVSGTTSFNTANGTTLVANNIQATSNLTANGTVNLGTVSNVKITGGTNGQFLQTDGTGNLTWATGGGGGGSGNPGGSTTQVQYNDAGVFAGSPTFTFNKTSNTLSVNYLATTLTAGPQPNITGVGTLGNLTVSGNATVGNVKTDHLLYSNGTPYTFTATPGGANTQVQFNDNGVLGADIDFTYNKTTNTLTVGNISGNGAGLSSITGANVTGTVGSAVISISANAANFAGNVTVAAQPNITSLGTLSQLNVNSTVVATQYVSNVATGTPPLVVSSNTLVPNLNVATANFASFANVASSANTIAGANVTGVVAFATYANSSGTATIATTAGTVTNSIQSNITQVGNLSSLTVTGNISAGNVIATHYGSGAGLTNIPAANITGSIANATYAANSGYATTAGSAGSANTANVALTVSQGSQPNITSVGTLSVLTVSGDGIIGNVRTDNLKYANGVSWVFYGNTNVANYLPTYTGNVAGGNLTITTTATVGTLKTNTLQYANGTSWTFYGNSDVANYLPTFTGNIKAGNANITGTTVSGIIRTDNLQYANGTPYSLNYGNSNVATYLPTYTGNLAGGNLSVTSLATIGTVKTDNLQYANGVVIPVGYGNSNVATYLATNTGVISTANLQATGGAASSLMEPVLVVSTAPTATTNINLNTNTVILYTAATTTNITLNARANATATLNSMMSVGQSITFSVILTNPSTGSGYIINAMTIDGTSVVVRWVSGSPQPTLNGLDMYTFSIIKTGSATYTVIASRGTTV